MSSSSAARVQKHRQSLRAAGLKPVQIWVPDTSNPKFQEECRKQSMSLNLEHEKQTLEWLEAAADTEGWE